MVPIHSRIQNCTDPGGEYIRNLISEGEHTRLDFKFSVTDSKKIARTLAAFANTEGGRLLIGVKDNGAIAGMRSDEEFYMVQAAGELYTKPQVHFSVMEWDVEGKTVLEVIIPCSKQELHSAPDKDGKYKIFIRVNDQNFTVNRVWLKAYRWRQRETGVFVNYSESVLLLLKWLENNDFLTLPEYRKLSGVTYNQAENILSAFVALGIIEIIFTEKDIFYRYSKQFKLPSLNERSEKITKVSAHN
jgi:predicted HTH transcriptional regulator